METTKYDQAAAAERHNQQMVTALRAAKAGRGYAAVYLGGEKIHASRATVRGWGGFHHPRALCQPHTPRSFASILDGDRASTVEVTCERCKAGLAKRGIEI